jgi:hypothetical protein
MAGVARHSAAMQNQISRFMEQPPAWMVAARPGGKGGDFTIRLCPVPATRKCRRGRRSWRMQAIAMGQAFRAP